MAGEAGSKGSNSVQVLFAQVLSFLTSFLLVLSTTVSDCRPRFFFDLEFIDMPLEELFIGGCLTFIPPCEGRDLQVQRSCMVMSRQAASTEGGGLHA